MFILLLIIFHNFCSSVLIFAGTANFFFPMEIWKLVVVTCMLLASIEYYFSQFLQFRAYFCRNCKFLFSYGNMEIGSSYMYVIGQY